MDRRGIYRHIYAALERASVQPLLEPAVQPIRWDQGGDADLAEAAASRPQQQGAAAHRAGEQLCCLLVRLLEAMVLESKLPDTARQVRRVMRVCCSWLVLTQLRACRLHF